MWVISKARLREFWEQYPDAEKPLKVWYKAADAASWTSIQDVRRTFPQADAVDLPCGLVVTVFNIGGNKYRLIAGIVYDAYTVYVRRVMTHAEYTHGAWKVQLCNE